MYQKMTRLLQRFMKPASIFKLLFNLSPMYRRSTGRIQSVSPDLLEVVIRIPLNFKNRNYAGSIFGGSLFSATDPIYMIQLIQILGEDYVVWDKSAAIRYRKPGRETLTAVFSFTWEEIEKIKQQVATEQSISWHKHVDLTGPDGTVYCSVDRELYVADKAFYKASRAAKANS